MTDINYKDIDIEIRDLVKYLNKFDGIETYESCFGHNEVPCMIWFRADSIKAINDMIFSVFDYDVLWHIEINTADFPKDCKNLRFVLTSGNVKDFPTVNLMVENLTNRLEKYFKKGEQDADSD